MRGKLAGQRQAVAVKSNQTRSVTAGVMVLAQSVTVLATAGITVSPAVVAAAEPGDGVHRSFAPADVAQRMALPSSAATEAAVLREQALIERAQRDAGAAAEVRRRAEELSRRFVAGDAAGGEQGDPGSPGETETVPAAMLPPSESAAPLRAPPPPQRVLTPVASPVTSPAVAAATTPHAAPGEDPLAVERRRAEAAEALAQSERAARLAAEAHSRLLLDRATEAMAKAQRDARAAVRRAAEAESRAAKAATASAAQPAAKTKTAAPVAPQAGGEGAGSSTGASGLGFSLSNALGLR